MHSHSQLCLDAVLLEDFLIEKALVAQGIQTAHLYTGWRQIGVRCRVDGSEVGVVYYRLQLIYIIDKLGPLVTDISTKKVPTSEKSHCLYVEHWGIFVLFH